MIDRSLFFKTTTSLEMLQTPSGIVRPCKHQTQYIRIPPRFCCEPRSEAAKSDFLLRLHAFLLRPPPDAVKESFQAHLDAIINEIAFARC